jgi:transcriptional regulator with XRE-family HTH domain
MVNPRGSIYSQLQKEIVRRLRQARQEAGLSQAQVAQSLGLSQSFISKLEAGQVRLEVLLLLRLARLYGKPLEFFIPPQEGPQR